MSQFRRPRPLKSWEQQLMEAIEERASQMIALTLQWSGGTDTSINEEVKKLPKIQIKKSKIASVDLLLYMAMRSIYNAQPTAGEMAYKKGLNQLITTNWGDFHTRCCNFLFKTEI